MPVKIFISVDMEGVSGVVHRDHTARDGQDYEMARRLMTLEANAAVEGAFEGGADEVVVNDSHGTLRSLLPELLDARARHIAGSPKPQSMMAGLDDSFDAALCVGYHARAGTQGILDHTLSGGMHDLRINGRSLGELGVNAGIAAYHGVPIVLVTGDTAATAQGTELIPDIEVASVKEPLTRHAANCLSPSAAQDLIRAKAQPSRGAADRDRSCGLRHARYDHHRVGGVGHGRRGRADSRRRAVRRRDRFIHLRRLSGGV